MAVVRMAGSRKGHAYRLLRQRVLREERDCVICGEWVDKSLPGTHPDGPTLEHLVELDAGGEELDRKNCALAHLRCNSSRGAKYLHQKRAAEATAPRVTSRSW